MHNNILVVFYVCYPSLENPEYSKWSMLNIPIKCFFPSPGFTNPNHHDHTKRSREWAYRVDKSTQVFRT